MTGRERVLSMLQGSTPDRLPCMPITMMFAGDTLGVPYAEYARNHEVLADAQIRTAEEFDFDYVSAISDPAREASDLGAAVEWFQDQPPAIVESRALLADKEALKVWLQRYILTARYSAGELSRMASVNTLSGESLSIRSRPGVLIIGGTRVVERDIAATNGVIHSVDTVVLP